MHLTTIKSHTSGFSARALGRACAHHRRHMTQQELRDYYTHHKTYIETVLAQAGVELNVSKLAVDAFRIATPAPVTLIEPEYRRCV